MVVGFNFVIYFLIIVDDKILDPSGETTDEDEDDDSLISFDLGEKEKNALLSVTGDLKLGMDLSKVRKTPISTYSLNITGVVLRS